MTPENAVPGRRPTPFGLPRWVVWAIGMGVLLLVGFGFGWFTATGPVDGLRAELEAAETRAAGAEERITRLEAELGVERALALLQGAVGALEGRNFGLAEERLQRAGAALEGVRPELAGVDPAGLEALRADVAGARVQVSQDVVGQSARLGALASRLQELLGR